MPLVAVAPIDWSSTLDPATHYLAIPNAGSFTVQNADRSYSLTAPDASTLRFEVHSGDIWTAADTAVKERSEICDGVKFANGTMVNIGYQFMIEPGAANTANWSVFGQLHADDNLNASPPFAINLGGSDDQKMVVYVGSVDPSTGKNTYNAVYTDTADIQRGHYYAMDIKVDFLGNGQGTLQIIRDGVKIVDYAGAMGINGQTYTYWKEGIYREASPESLAADYRNLTITAGGSTATGGTTGTTTGTTTGGTTTGGTTSPGSTSPGAVAPTVSFVEKLALDTGISATDLVSANGRAILTGTATAGAAIAIYDGKTLIGSTVASATGAWTFAGNLSAGVHVLTAQATLNGLTNTAGPGGPIVIDAMAPGAPTVGIMNDGVLNTAGFTHNAHVVLAGRAEANAAVKVYGDAGLLGTVTAGADGSWSYDTGRSYADGHYTFFAKATDLAGNTGAASTYLHATVDTVAPVPTLSSAAVGSGGLTLQGLSETGSTVTLSEGGKVAVSAIAGAVQAWTAALPADGASHKYLMTAVDAAGNISVTHDVIVGAAGGDTVTALKAGDFLIGAGGSDVFVMNTATGSGTTLVDFHTGVDKIQFTGFAAADASVTQVDATHWTVTDHVHTETFTLGAGATLHAGDWFFS